MTFLEALTFRGIQFRRNTSRRNEINLCCPFCDDGRFRLGLNYARSMAHCFNCGWKSRKAVRLILIQFEIDSRNVVDAAIDREVQKDDEKTLELPADFTLLSTAEPDDGPLWDAKEYLTGRGFPEHQIKDHYLGACLSGRFAYRVIIPIVYKEELKGVVGRDWTQNREPKYLNTRGERSVYNLEKAATASSPLFLSEGCFKALAIEDALKSYRVRSSALLGHSVTDLQVEQIRESGFRKVVIWTDPDSVGVRGFVNVANRLAAENLDVRFVYPFPEADADELEPDMIRTLAFGAKPWTTALSQRVRLKMLDLC